MQTFNHFSFVDAGEAVRIDESKFKFYRSVCKLIGDRELPLTDWGQEPTKIYAKSVRRPRR